MTLSYEVSKRIKEFLGEDAPASLESMWWCDYDGIRVAQGRNDKNMTWAYGLEDLLSRPFCHAMFMKHMKPESFVFSFEWKTIAKDIAEAYINGGYPGVEKCLLELMK